MTTATATRELQVREAINEAIRQEMERDETIVIMGEEIAGGAGREHLGIVDAWGGPFRTTVGLIQQFGNQRVLDTPLSEAAFVGTAIGAASTGTRAIAELMFVDFIGVCMDQMLNNAAKMRYMFGGQVKVPFTMLTRIGAGFGSAAQHSESYYSIFSHIPGLKGVIPSDPYTAKGLLISAIRDDDPVVFFEHKGLYTNRGPVPEEPYTIPIGKARTVREGTDVTLVGLSKMTWTANNAAEELAKEGINAEVVDLLSISPIDYDHVLESVRKTHRIVVVDEAYFEYVNAPDYGSAMPLVTAGGENVIVTRTFSKFYGLAGLRVGWAHVPSGLVAPLARVRGPYPVSSLAMAGAAAALTDFEFQKRAKAHNDKWLPWLVSEVEKLGYETSRSEANFVLFRIPDGAEAARALEDALTEKGFIGRTAHQNALPNWIRFSVGTEKAMTGLVKELKAYGG